MNNKPKKAVLNLCLDQPIPKEKLCDSKILMILKKLILELEKLQEENLMQMKEKHENT